MLRRNVILFLLMNFLSLCFISEVYCAEKQKLKFAAEVQKERHLIVS